MPIIPWGPIRSCLTENFSFGDIKQIIGYANLDMSKLAHLEQKSQGGASKSQLLSAIDLQIVSLNEKELIHIINICCEEMLRRKPQTNEDLENILSRVGWKFNGSLIPIEIFDIDELYNIPDSATHDIIKAASRLRDGDLSGALSSACGAVDSATTNIFIEYNLGDPTKKSFQDRIKDSINAINAKDRLINELKSLGWQDQDTNSFIHNLTGSLNQASFVMQKLRSDMGDVHGTKPVLNAMVYDSIKWALLLLRVLSTKDDF